jgi:hypothetical protein
MNLTTICFGTILIINQNLIAQNTRESYENKSRIEIENGTSSGSSRGECDDIDVKITPRPNQGFSLQINKIPSVPMKFSVTEPYVVESLSEIELPIENKGTIELMLPDNFALKLEENKNYVWTAAFYCGNSPQWYLRGLLRLKNDERKNLPTKEKAKTTLLKCREHCRNKR